MSGIVDELIPLEDTLRAISPSLVDSWSADDEFQRFCSTVLTLASPHTAADAVIPSLPDGIPLHDLVNKLIQVIIVPVTGGVQIVTPLIQTPLEPINGVLVIVRIFI